MSFFFGGGGGFFISSHWYFLFSSRRLKFYGLGLAFLNSLLLLPRPLSVAPYSPCGSNSNQAYTPLFPSDSRVSRDDAAGLSIPHIVLASKNETSDEIEVYSKTVATNGHGGYVETYPDMWHGWMGSRADLVNGHSRGEFARG